MSDTSSTLVCVFFLLAVFMSIGFDESELSGGFSDFSFILVPIVLTIPLGITISRIMDSRKYGVRVNWFPFYFALAICGILAMVPVYVGVTDSNISSIAILVGVEIIVYFYVESDWRKKLKGKDPKEKVYKTKTKDLSSIVDLHEIEELKLRKKKMTHIDLTPLAQCQKLRVLDLSNNRLKAIDLSTLSLCVNLETLMLDDNLLTEIDLSPLASLSSFRVLTMQENKIESDTLESLSYCVNLEELHLGWTNMKEIDLSPLSQCNKLKNLSIVGAEFATINLEPLRNCPDLYYLGFAVFGIKELDLTPLESCNLHTIEFNWASPDSMNVTALFSIPGLVKLNGIWPATKMWTTKMPSEISEWPITLRDYRDRIELV